MTHGHPREDALGKASAEGGFDALADYSQSSWLGRGDVAGALWRYRLECHTATSIRGGARGYRCSSAECVFIENACAGADDFRQLRAAGIFFAADPHR